MHQLENRQLQVISELLLVIAGELAIQNSKKHIESGMNKIVIKNIKDIGRDIVTNKNIMDAGAR